jgi:hypothetical protein
MKRRNASLCLTLSFIFLLCGCPKRYVVTVPDQVRPGKDQPSSDCKPYVLFNSGLSYIPFGQQIDAERCGAAGTLAGAVSLVPGMRLQINQISLMGDSTKITDTADPGAPSFPSQHIVQAPTVSHFDWVKPEGSSPLSRDDYFFLSYLITAGFPLKKSATATYSPSDLLKTLDDKDTAREALDSVRVFYTSSSSNQKLNLASASWVKDLMNPTNSTASDKPEYLGLTFAAQEVVLFQSWDNAKYSSNPLDANEGNHGQSILFKRDYRIYTGHSLATVDVPVRLNTETISRFVPAYWSIRDLETAYNVAIVGVRRNIAFLTEEFKKKYLVPVPDEKELSANGYFTLWFQQPSWSETKQSNLWGARGYIALPKVAKGNTLVLDETKKEMLLAPGDVLIVGRTLPGTDKPGYR